MTASDTLNPPPTRIAIIKSIKMDPIIFVTNKHANNLVNQCHTYPALMVL
jgi:hypothetical protein